MSLNRQYKSFRAVLCNSVKYFLTVFAYECMAITLVGQCYM